MRVRVINHPEGVKIVVPIIPELLERDIKNNGWETFPQFDCDSSSIPLRKLLDGTCQRCHWKCDMINKKVIVKKTFDCEHDILKRITEKINNIDKQTALDGLLELEKFRLNRGK